MSEENVEVVRRIVRAFDERDNATAVAPLDPRIEWDATRSPAEDVRGKYEGLEGVADFWMRWLSAWRTVEVGEPELFDGGDKILGWFTDQRNVGRHSGIELPNPPFGFLYTFRGNKIVRVTLYVDKAEALEAAGLSE
jgi:ketosteroid isomerase-like protein